MRSDDEPREISPPWERDLGGRRFTTPALLLLLSQGPAHGYELWTRLGAVLPRSGPLPEPVGCYRLLRSLEDDGALVSSWETSHTGPTRRVYTLTKDGCQQLDGWAASVERDVKAMRHFLGAYRSTIRSRRPPLARGASNEKKRRTKRRPRTDRDTTEA